MTRRFAYTVLASLGCMLGLAATPANAQFQLKIGGGYGNPGIYVGTGPKLVPGVYPSVSYAGSSYHADHHYHVKYRQPLWKEQTFHSRYEARRFADYKASQGFETIILPHGLHFDVRYRMLHWATYQTVHSDGAAHRLEHYLESQGYQAKVVHH